VWLRRNHCAHVLKRFIVSAPSGWINPVEAISTRVRLAASLIANFQSRPDDASAPALSLHMSLHMSRHIMRFKDDAGHPMGAYSPQEQLW
jgi:hypothetical protein